MAVALWVALRFLQCFVKHLDSDLTIAYPLLKLISIQADVPTIAEFSLSGLFTGPRSKPRRYASPNPPSPSSTCLPLSGTLIAHTDTRVNT